MYAHRRLDTWTRYVDRFIAISRFGRDLFTRYGIPGDRIEVQTNVVSDPGERSQPPSQSGQVLFVGRLTDEKGIDFLLDAWQQADLRDFELVVVGDGPRASSLRERRIDGVRFEGIRSPDEVRDHMLRARCLVFPSQWFEGQGLVIVEAAAAGLPSLVSDLGAVPEVLGSDRDAWAVPPGDVEAWASALHRLADDAFIDGAGSRARARYEQYHTPEVGLERLLKAYDQVLQRSPRP